MDKTSKTTTIDHHVEGLRPGPVVFGDHLPGGKSGQNSGADDGFALY